MDRSCFKFVVGSGEEVKPLEEKIDVLLKMVSIESKGNLLVESDCGEKHRYIIHIKPSDPAKGISRVVAKQDAQYSFEARQDEFVLIKEDIAYKIHYK